ncbi:protein mono-ADP-ribosyltransferase PARP6-like [Liolophura sinensis]|uniref:protein mono-ADP-ribosyltransferase PARP6-like n=1 Tax=Liolophura sinensis TaxID=3198878 RepID=UPI003158AE57
MQSRLETFRSDANQALEKYSQSCSPFQELEVGDQCFSFTHKSLDRQTRYVCYASEDYPENTFLSCLDEPSMNTTYNVGLHNIMAQLNLSLEEGGENTALPYTSSEMGNSAGSSNACLHRMISQDSAASSYADCVSDLSSEEDCAEYYHDQDYDDDCDASCAMHPLLEEDIENCRLLYSDRSLQYRLFRSIDDIDVELHIPFSFLQGEVANAWGVTTDEPLVIRLHMSVTMYLDSTNAPKLEVFQPTRQAKCGVASQMRAIMETFINQHWKSLTNEKVKSLSSSVHVLGRPKHSFTMSEIAGANPASGCIDYSTIDDASLAHLVDMGFSMEASRNALIITRGEVSEATDLLLSNPDRCENVNIANTSKNVKDKSVNRVAQNAPAVPVNKPPPLPPRQQMSNPSVKKFMKLKPKFTKRQSSMVNSNTAPDLQASFSTNSLSTDAFSRKETKSLPSLEHGFLVQVYQYARQRIPTLNEYCVVCDEPHVFKNDAMLKPAVCSRELCVFAYQTLGVMADAAEDIAAGPEVVDLLIAMATAACRSPRKDLIFDPYPTVVDPKNPNELALHPKKKDFVRVSQSLENFLSMHKMTQFRATELKREMDARDSLCYPLLQWIITSNRSHIVKIPLERQLSFMNTPHQFLLLSSPPAKEAVFRAEKLKFGSTFAFHGSHIENWHSILRNGLMNASGTKFQMNGAAFGKGIYLSPTACVSFGYSGMYMGHKALPKDTKKKEAEDAQSIVPQYPAVQSRFLKGKNINCIALCEVITKELRKSGDVWVCPNSNHVCTRFFFLYEDGQVGNANVDTQQEQFKKDILLACGYKACYLSGGQ